MAALHEHATAFQQARETLKDAHNCFPAALCAQETEG